MPTARAAVPSAPAPPPPATVVEKVVTTTRVAETPAAPAAPTRPLHGLENPDKPSAWDFVDSLTHAQYKDYAWYLYLPEEEGRETKHGIGRAYLCRFDPEKDFTQDFEGDFEGNLKELVKQRFGGLPFPGRKYHLKINGRKSSGREDRAQYWVNFPVIGKPKAEDESHPTTAATTGNQPVDAALQFVTEQLEQIRKSQADPQEAVKSVLKMFQDAHNESLKLVVAQANTEKTEKDPIQYLEGMIGVLQRLKLMPDPAAAPAAAPNTHGSLVERLEEALVQKLVSQLDGNAEHEERDVFADVEKIKNAAVTLGMRVATGGDSPWNEFIRVAGPKIAENLPAIMGGLRDVAIAVVNRAAPGAARAAVSSGPGTALARPAGVVVGAAQPAGQPAAAATAAAASPEPAVPSPEMQQALILGFIFQNVARHFKEGATGEQIAAWVSGCDEQLGNFLGAMKSEDLKSYMGKQELLKPVLEHPACDKFIAEFLEYFKPEPEQEA